MKISELAKRSGQSVETIRYYERRGVLPLAHRGSNGYRHYAEADVQRLGFVQRAQNLGFSLDEISRLLQLQDGGDKADVRALARQKLAMVEAKLADLTRMRDTLQSLCQQCSGHGTVATCPIIEDLMGQRGDPANG